MDPQPLHQRRTAQLAFATIELRAEARLEPLINMMLRCRLPGGVIKLQQWLGIDAFAAR